jgi:formate hydrogenlyase subunit 3/multisubunit Na+/H+ antiporter MnhD subunit
VVLAYSSISQMGYLLTLLGVALLSPNLWDTIVIAVLFFSIHHAINKSALFLLSGEIIKNGLNHHFILLGLIFSLSLIGVRYTSGSVAKQMILDSISGSSILLPILGFSMIVTTLLILKVYYLSYKTPQNSALNLHTLYILYPMAGVSLLLFVIVI